MDAKVDQEPTAGKRRPPRLEPAGPDRTPVGTRYVLGEKNPRGKLTVLIHGVGGGSFVFDDMHRKLEEDGFRVLSYDCMGHGLSYPP